MQITKEAKAEQKKGISEEELEIINKFSKQELGADEIYTFDILLCDNDVDRDFERFSTRTLVDLSKLFLGKTGIFDHNWSATGQKARIYKTEVCYDESKSTVCGEKYAYLKASAYMLNTKENEELIKEINGGIKREVSVGCSVKASVCSICGEETGSSKCGHVKGREYGGRTCYAVLDGATDAYEWSFVAVPAQKNAGIMKHFEKGKAPETLKEYIASVGGSGAADEIRELEKRAEMGDRYLKSLKKEVVRLGVLSEMGMKREFLEKVMERLGEEELLGFKKAFERKTAEIYPPSVQLKSYKSREMNKNNEDFLI